MQEGGDIKLLKWMEEHAKGMEEHPNVAELLKVGRVARELNEAAEEAVRAYQQAADSLTEEDLAYVHFIYSVYELGRPL